MTIAAQLIEGEFTIESCMVYAKIRLWSMRCCFLPDISMIDIRLSISSSSNIESAFLVFDKIRSLSWAPARKWPKTETENRLQVVNESRIVYKSSGGLEESAGRADYPRGSRLLYSHWKIAALSWNIVCFSLFTKLGALLAWCMFLEFLTVPFKN